MTNEQNNNTHAITTPNSRAPMTIEGFRQMLAKNYMRQLTNYLGGDERKSMKFLSAAVYVMQKVPKLLECDPATVIQSLMSAAEFELYPSNVAGEAYILPYKGKAQFQLGYQGIITLLSRAGIATNSQIVRKNDHFVHEEGANPKLEHKWDSFATDEQRGEPIGVYAILTNTLGQQFRAVMGKEAVMKIKNLSQAKDSEYSPWNSKQDPEMWMWRKTAIKQASKQVPKTEVLQKALAADNEDSVIVKPPLDAAGPATAPALHAPTAAPSHKPADTVPPEEVQQPPQEELPVIQMEDEPKG